MKRTTAVVLTLVLSSGVVLATTWGKTQRTCPITGEKVDSADAMSYGGYIYRWESKRDLIFWPWTDEEWITLNPKNGYGAFNPHFEKLPEEERPKLRQWLEKNFRPGDAPNTHLEKLAWLERVYEQRTMDDDFWSTFYRLMTYLHSADPEKSLAYMKKAMKLVEKKYASDPKGIARIETLYLLGEYHRRLGHVEKARAFFQEAKVTPYVDPDDNKEKTGHPYYLELIAEREKLIPG